ncbi:MAG: nucleotidyl transferase AbiEii/AbiGii toxin family protein [Trueperaceae bacterium]|nr:nucleotidyl transferase AbiEii/AbiGii toxin family protein [Trueperaceae bacterium]
MERSTLVELFAALAAEGVDYVLVGGMAVNLHGIVRATEDADLFVRPDEENVARLRRALHRVTGDPVAHEARYRARGRRRGRGALAGGLRPGGGALMPVHRFRAIDDVPPAAARDVRDPATGGLALDHIEAMTVGLPPLFAAGVYRYASVEAAGADRERALRARMRRLRATRRRLGGALGDER